MNFKDQYQQAFKNAAPSPELQQETLELMQEARDHKLQKAPQPKPLRPVRWVSAAAALAAVVLCVVLVGVWLNQGRHYNDLMEEDIWETVDDAFTGQEEQVPDQDQKPQGGNEIADSMVPEQDDEGTDSTGSGQDDQFADSMDPDTDEVGDSFNKDQSSNSMGSNSITNSPQTEDDKAETVIPEKTFESFDALITALKNKSAPGYGKNYYLSRDLLVVPATLPDGWTFGGVTLDPENGRYRYEYRVQDNGVDYLLTFAATADAPKTLAQLHTQQQALATETVTVTDTENTRTYQFGDSQSLVVTLTAAADQPLPTSQDVARILSGFAPERCSLNNPNLERVY